MAAYLVLGQANPAAATLTTAGTVGASDEWVVSSCVVCNRSTVPTDFRIAMIPGGGAVSNEDYIYYDVPIGGNDTFIATIGVTLEASSLIRVYATLATLSFNFYGSEITP